MSDSIRVKNNEWGFHKLHKLWQVHDRKQRHYNYTTIKNLPTDQTAESLHHLVDCFFFFSKDTPTIYITKAMSTLIIKKNSRTGHMF